MTSPLKAELAGIQATLDASLQREREANERIAALKAEVDRLMGVLNRAGDDYQTGVEVGLAEIARLKTVAFQAQNAAIDLVAQVATLTADLSARMSQLNEARAATVEANMALADALNVGALAVEVERELCAQLADEELAGSKRNAAERDTGARIAAAIRSRKS